MIDLLKVSNTCQICGYHNHKDKIIYELGKDYLHYFFYDGEFVYYDFQDCINNTYIYISVSKDISFIDFYKDDTYQTKLLTISYNSNESLNFNNTEELFDFFKNLNQKFIKNSIFE